MMMMQLSVEEIDDIISRLQEPYAYDLIKRLQQLKTETQFYIQMENQRLLDRLYEEDKIKEQGGFGTSPVSHAYFQIEEGNNENRNP